MHLVELAEDYDGIKKEPSSRYACHAAFVVPRLK